MECGDCGIKLSNKANLKRHFKVVHNVVIISKSPLVCPLCEHSGDKLSLINHFDKIHDISVKTECLKFPDTDSFEKWKINVEKQTVAKFIKNSTNKVKNSSSYRYYKCHRSGHFTSEGAKKRNLKRKGSNKINGYCPASMYIHSRNGEVSVRFISTHVGHEMQLEKIPLSPTERNEIARKIQAKLPFEKILQDLRTSSSENSKSRLHLITRQDLRNIKNSMNLDSARELFDGDKKSMNVVSVCQVWKEEVDVEEQGNVSLEQEPMEYGVCGGPSNENIELVIEFAPQDEDVILEKLKAGVIEQFEKAIELIKASNSLDYVKEAENLIKPILINSSSKIDDFIYEPEKNSSQDLKRIELKKELTEDGLIIL